MCYVVDLNEVATVLEAVQVTVLYLQQTAGLWLPGCLTPPDAVAVVEMRLVQAWSVAISLYIMLAGQVSQVWPVVASWAVDWLSAVGHQCLSHTAADLACQAGAPLERIVRQWC